MVTLAHASNVIQLTEVLPSVHDWWLNIEQLSFDQTSGLLSIPLTSGSKGQGKRRTIEIKHVSAYNIEDTERIGFYDVNEIRYDESNKQLSITTGVPLTLTIDVSNVDLTVFD